MPSSTSEALEPSLIRCHPRCTLNWAPSAMVSFLAQNSLPRLKPCQVNIHAASEKFPPKFMAATPVLRLRGRLSCHFALKVKSAFAGAPALTVTFCVCVP